SRYAARGAGEPRSASLRRRPTLRIRQTTRSPPQRRRSGLPGAPRRVRPAVCSCVAPGGTGFDLFYGDLVVRVDADLGGGAHRFFGDFGGGQGGVFDQRT